MKKYILAILLLFSLNVIADTINGNYTHPTQREDGSGLLPAEIGGFNVYVDGLKRTDLSPLPGNATSFTLSVTTDSVVTVTTVDTDGRESIHSTPFPVNGKAIPNAPVVTYTVIISTRQ